jgi:hypothetical protein
MAEPTKDKDVVCRTALIFKMTESSHSKQLPSSVRFVLGAMPD